MNQFTSPELLAAAAQQKMLVKKTNNKRKLAISAAAPVPVSPTQLRGQEYEQRAANYLLQQGLTILVQNLKGRYGEIDIVARSAEHLIFVEVRQRVSNAYGGALYSVGRDKQQRIKLTAQHFLPTLCVRYFNNKMPFCRFDVIAIEGDSITWVTDAFN